MAKIIVFHEFPLGVDSRTENVIFTLPLACLTNFTGCKIFAYDHTINAPATRGKNIKYFKTGLGFGENLKPLSQLIAENEHQNTVIDYLKVCNSLFINKGGKILSLYWLPFLRLT